MIYRSDSQGSLHGFKEVLILTLFLKLEDICLTVHINVVSAQSLEFCIRILHVLQY